jgi:hypothetical protein
MLVLSLRTCQNARTMTKYMLRRLGVADDPGSRKPTLQGCMEAVLDQSGTLMDDVLGGLKASLLPGKGKHASSQALPHAKATIETLCEQADSVKAVFAKTLRAAIYGGDNQRRGGQPLVRFDDFQFLEEGEIDANIEFALTQQEVMLAVDDVLPTLNALVSGLLGWVTVQPHLNPLKPESFVHALRETIAQHVPDDAARASVMTLAAGKMGVSLRQLYKEVSDWMRSQGVEAAGLPVTTVGGLGGPTKPVENTMSRTMLTLDKLRRLLSGELDPSPVAGGVRDFINTVPASFDALQDMKMVEPMMKRLAARASLSEAASASSGSSLLAAGARALQRERTQSNKLGRQLGEEVVRLMLENLLQDRRLLARVRTNLKALEPVLIKLSQGDARFFTDRQHPARQLLDKLTHRSLAFTSDDEPGFARFQTAFDAAVGVLCNGEGDGASFAQVLHTLESGWTRDEEDQRKRSEEAARALLRTEQRNLLAQRLAVEFNARMEGKRVPDMVVNFLRGPWAQVVSEAQLKYADGSGDASDYQSLADDLIWSVQLKLARRNRTRLVQMVPGMLVKMRQGLHLIAYPEQPIADFFDELITYHEKAFESVRAVPSGTPIDSVVDRVDLADAESSMTPDAFWMAESESTDSGFMQDVGDIPLDFTRADSLPAPIVDASEWSVESLNTGAWVDLALGGLWVRAQLTWASPHRTLFMFISGGGMAHSMSRRTMDRLKGLNLLRLVSDGRIMDNALDAVAQTALRNDANRAMSDD